MFFTVGQKFRERIPSGLMQPKFTAAFTLFMATFFTTYFLEPFEIYPPEHTINYFWICFFRGVLGACLTLLYLTFIRPEANWTIQKKLFHAAFFLWLFGTINFLIRDIIYDNPNNWSIHFFLTELRNTFLFGIFIFWLMFSFNYKLLLRGSEGDKRTSDSSPMAFTPVENVDTATIITQVKADDFLLPLEHFIMAKTEGNYTEIFTIESSGLQKHLKRIPLKSLEGQLSSYPWLVRTHRSYLINQRMVENIMGNAQGYQLSLKHYPEKVPVSRAFIPHFNKANVPVTLAT